MCHWLRRNLVSEERLVTFSVVSSGDITETIKKTWAEVIKVYWYRTVDININWISLREEITKILKWSATKVISSWDVYSLYDYVTIARKNRPNPCDDELTDILLADLKLKHELIYISANWEINVWKSYL